MTRYHCRADVRLYLKMYCNQFWGNGSDAVLLPYPEPTESIPLADVFTRRWIFLFICWPLPGSECAFQELLWRFPINCRPYCLRNYRFCSLCVLCLCYTFCRFSVLGTSQNQAFKFQYLKLAMKLDVLWNLTKLKRLNAGARKNWTDNDENSGKHSM